MWGRRRIRSALFIDFENLPLPPEAIPNWLAWLEDGQFDDGRRRNVLVKRVYWNSSAEKHRDGYLKRGFDVILCEKFATMKNGADIRMAMDVVELTHTNNKIDEFILVTTDSDFVPVLQRLDEKSRRSVIVVNEARSEIHTTYRQHADILIPRRKLAEAKVYIRPKRGISSWFTRAPNKAPSPPLAPVAVAKPAVVAAPLSAAPARPAIAPPVLVTPASLQSVVDRVIKVTSLTPKAYTGQKRVMVALRALPGFQLQGANSFFGKGSYKALMKSLAKIDTRLHVIDQMGGGTGVMYVPNSEPDGKEASPAGTTVN